MNALRRLPNRNLIAVLAGVIALAGSVTAVSVAALGDGGPVPPVKPLAQAVRDSLVGRTVAGVSADISFTNKLVNSAGLPRSSPLLSGATGRLWASSDGRLRLELQSDRGDTEVLLTRTTATLYDTATNTVYEARLPARTAGRDRAAGVPTVTQIQDRITRLMDGVSLSGAIPSNVGGEPAYTVRISPKHAGGLLGSAELAWDANHAIPLRVAVYAQGYSSPVLELKATRISFGAVPARDFAISPQPGSKIVRVAQDQPKVRRRLTGRRRTVIDGIGAVAKSVPFKLTAPATLAGLPRTSVKLLDWGSAKAALITYGRRLGAILVVERLAGKTAPTGQAADKAQAALGAVEINGSSGRELETALGTALWFERGGVSYIVAGSVARTAAEAAARGL